jgi:hypothetical protein
MIGDSKTSLWKKLGVGLTDVILLLDAPPCCSHVPLPALQLTVAGKSGISRQRHCHCRRSS